MAHKSARQMTRKGYVIIFLFSLFNAIGRTFYCRIYIAKDYAEISFGHILLRIIILFLIFFIPGLIAVRWYYRLKDKK
jgi:hypothetical protein